MRALVEPGRLSGTVQALPSKSQSHRLLIAARLSETPATVHNLGQSHDIAATWRCMDALLAPGGGLARLDCGESGSTLRFLIPLALALRGGGCFFGQGRLLQRPLEPYFQLFQEKRITFQLLPDRLTVQGALCPGPYSLPGNVSSQFVTGLLYALPLLDGDSEIRLTTRLESEDYVNMTLQALAAFGVQAEKKRWGYLIPGGQHYRGGDQTVEGDWSGAAFWLAARVLGSPVTVTGLDPNSAQGDRAAGALAGRLACPGDVEIDLSPIPDLAPPLAAMALLRRGRTRFVNAARLRLKESDRLSAIAQVLGAMGACVTEGADTLELQGQETLAGGTSVSSWNDHRIAMMAAVAATICQAPVEISGAEAVNKSYPDFWRDFAALGGRVRLLEG